MRNYYCEHCQEQLEVSLHYVPCYDDGGGLDSMDVEERVHDCDCQGAQNARAIATTIVQPMRPSQAEPPYETDDLPF